MNTDDTDLQIQDGPIELLISVINGEVWDFVQSRYDTKPKAKS
jgi:hypothetical protein